MTAKVDKFITTPACHRNELAQKLRNFFTYIINVQTVLLANINRGIILALNAFVAKELQKLLLFNCYYFSRTKKFINSSEHTLLFRTLIVAVDFMHQDKNFIR